MQSERNSKLPNPKLQKNSKTSTIDNDNNDHQRTTEANENPRATAKTPSLLKTKQKTAHDESANQQPQESPSSYDFVELVQDLFEVPDTNDCGDQGQQPISAEVSLADLMPASNGVAPANNCACSNSQAVSPIGKRIITAERINKLRRIALEAANLHKTFTIRGCFYSIRRGLIARGWVEKFDVHRRQNAPVLCQSTDLELVVPDCKPGLSRRAHISKCERNIVSRFLENKPIDFLWCARKERSDFTDMIKNPGMKVSRLNRNPFTSKSGMCRVLRDFHWFFEEGKSELYYPRSYNVFLADDLAEFVDDFRMSACIAMLRFVVQTFPDTEISIDEPWCPSTIPNTAVQFAIDQCQRYVRFVEHLDIDETTPPADRESDEHDWEVFLNHHRTLTVDGGWLAANEHTPLLLTRAAAMLTLVETHWPQSSLDGVRNIWIVKPSNRCRGRGIRLMNDLRKIVDFVNPSAYLNKGHWVVQKYIERPLIIHNCKFDIRQWFLVTSVQPLVIWMYRESYLRFSSQEFSLVNLHESVHLTNHAVQKRYRNDNLRDQRLPKDNMWDCHTFRAYLQQIGEIDQWTNRIYPGMQKALIGTMLASQELMDRRANTFELFGADFMVTSDFQPWLIEINSSPDLAASTSVTARMCPQCLEDLVKVVIDYRNDPKAPTGKFELIYKQSVPPAPSYLGLDLFVLGTPVHKSTLKNTKTVISSFTSPRNPTVIPTPVRPPIRTRRTPMPMIKAPRIESTESPARSTARRILPKRIVKQTLSKKPTRSANLDLPNTELDLLLADCRSKTTSRILISHSDAAKPQNNPSKPTTFVNHDPSKTDLELLMATCLPRRTSRAHSDAATPHPSQNTNRLMSISVNPSTQMLRDIKNRERMAELRRRHATSGIRVIEPSVKNILSELTEFRCVGNKLVSRDKSLAIGRVPEMDASPTPMVIGAALADAAGRLLRRRSKSRKIRNMIDAGGGKVFGMKRRDLKLGPSAIARVVDSGSKKDSIVL